MVYVNGQDSILVVQSPTDLSARGARGYLCVAVCCERSNLPMLTNTRHQGAVAPSRSRIASSTAQRTRQKRSLHAVDTNIASYDRKDPFAAFNALRKLLSSLPARIGGCQFRLTQEEQKLSIHLLSIVEPVSCSAFSACASQLRKPLFLFACVYAFLSFLLSDMNSVRWDFAITTHSNASTD